MTDLLPLLSELLTLFKSGLGPAALAGSLITLLLRVYRTETLQKFLPKRARWDSLHPAAKFLLPFAAAFCGSLLLSLAGGAAVLSSLPAALMAALGAIGLHHGTKAIGQAQTNMALKAEGPSYRPNAFRRAASIIVPLGKTPQDVFDKSP